jgi:hypothetical protein
MASIVTTLLKMTEQSAVGYSATRPPMVQQNNMIVLFETATGGAHNVHAPRAIRQ